MAAADNAELPDTGSIAIDRHPHLHGRHVTNAVEFRDVDIFFARDAGRAGAVLLSKAQQLLDDGRNRAEILESTGVVVGVAGANLAVRSGEISVLMGLSGSGKSTLLRAANGLNPVTRGAVRVAHRGQVVDVATCSPQTLRTLRRGHIAMIFQQFGLLPWRTVRDNVGLGLEIRGEHPTTRRQRIDEKLALVGLSQWADHPVSELSGGMQQRVGLARAFATDAEILLMDEPFSSLDPLIRTKLQGELLSLQQQMKKTILFVTHDLDEALRLGNRISVLEGGRIVQTGSPEDIVLRPQGAYVTEFVQHVNPLSVLRGRMVMTRLEVLREVDQGIVFGAGERYHARRDMDGRLTVVTGDQVVELRERPVDTPLQELIQLQQHSGHPVWMIDGEQIVGVCTPEDVIRALAGARGAVKQAGGAN